MQPAIRLALKVLTWVAGAALAMLAWVAGHVRNLGGALAGAAAWACSPSAWELTRREGRSRPPGKTGHLDRVSPRSHVSHPPQGYGLQPLSHYKDEGGGDTLGFREVS